MITPVILCGGAGTRLWPLSRRSYPKQFTRLIGEESLYQACARRVSGPDFAPPLIVTQSDFRFIAVQQLGDVGLVPSGVLIEPEGRNTAPAILAAALHLAKTDPEGLMLVLPSDHAVPDTSAFQAAVQDGIAAAEAGQLVTFGIQPTHAETAYGYLELDGAAGTGPRPLRRFVEKPDAARAEAMLAQGNFLWNAGIFLFSVRTILEAFKAHSPALLPPVGAALDQARADLGFLRLDPAAWAGAQDISIDYAVMEKASNLMVVPFAEGWSDLGGWDAVWRAMGPDGAGVACSEGAHAIDCTDTLLRTDSENMQLVGIGLENIIAVAMNDAVLVADKRRAQDVKQAVSVLKARALPQATEFPKDHRPWGWFESLVVGPRFQVKRILVNPGAALSLQSHFHRSEHWIVVQGTAKVTVDDKVQLVTENQSVYIPLGAVHRMENPGKLPMVLIEVQTGSYVGEDDIIRYDDVYARDGQGAKG